MIASDTTVARSLPLPNVWSFGGGTQSAAIAALIIQGRLPKPDYAVMADTEREKSGTWLYLKHVVAPNLAEVGVTIEIAKKSDYATVDVFGGKDSKSVLLPVFTNQNGTVGKLPGYCSGEWKKRVVARYLKAQHGFSRYVSWMGMSIDEMDRMRVRGDYGPNYYPLLETVPMRRSDCVHLVTEIMGWPRPPRSACAECPNQGAEEWKQMRRESPADFARAVAFDAWIRETDPHAFLHPSCIPLSEVDFDAQTSLDMFGGDNGKGCDSGYCFV